MSRGATPHIQMASRRMSGPRTSQEGDSAFDYTERSRFSIALL